METNASAVAKKMKIDLLLIRKLQKILKKIALV